MLAVIPVLLCTLKRDSGVRSDECSDQGEALYPEIVQSLKIPAVWMIGESIIHVLYVHKRCSTLSPSNTRHSL